MDSRLANFRALTPAQRLDHIARCADLTEPERHALAEPGALGVTRADGMIENTIGTFELPFGVAGNFVVNGRDVLVPMVVEEPSVVAAASFMAKLARDCGGFQTSSTGPLMRAQVQVLGLSDPFGARQALLLQRDEIMALAIARDQVLVNTMAEAVSPLVEQITGGSVRLRILSNLADLRLARARVRLTPEVLATRERSGEQIIEGILDACSFATIDPYRAATHNKGIMNGVDPVIVATGNDWRAVEAGAHAYACRSGRYTSLTQWERDAAGALVGTIELPMPVGLVGGATKTHPLARIALKLLQVQTAQELGEVAAAVGLAQNLGALRALSTEGIQRGHMALHARNIALAAGATGDDIDRVARRMAEERDVRADRAIALLRELGGR
jgi:hydroxymethylglutaryl-CoA reductase